MRSSTVPMRDLIRVLRLATKAVKSDRDKTACRSMALFLDHIGAGPIPTSSGEIQTGLQAVEERMKRN
jgi:hypothetical protein